MMDYAPFPLIDLTGSPRERGRQHGKAAPDRIKRGIEMYSEVAAEERRRLEASRAARRGDGAGRREVRSGLCRGDARHRRGLGRAVRRRHADECPHRDGGGGAQAACAKHFPDGCTAALALPEASADGVLLHGQNWDWRAECAETGVVLRIRRDDGPDILTFTEAGGLARSGLNSAGIGLTANALECDRDYQRGPGVPLPFIRRKVLESAYLAEAVRTIFSTPKLGSNHMAVSHCGGEAFGFECAPDETFWLAPDRGVYVHANHWIAEAARAKVKDTGLQETPCSIYRDKRVRDQLAPKRGTLTLEDFRAGLLRRLRLALVGLPAAAAQQPRQLVATSAMILMRPGEGHLEACPMPALNKRFTTYSLTPDRRAEAGGRVDGWTAVILALSV